MKSSFCCCYYCCCCSSSCVEHRKKSTHQVPKNVPPLLHVYMLFCCCFSSSISLFAPFSLLLIFSYSHMFAHCCRAANKMSIRWIPWIPWLLSLIHVKLELKIAWNRTYLTWTTNSQNTQATNRDALKAQSHLRIPSTKTTTTTTATTTAII